MKCQQCEKPATFHITELTEPTGPVMVHLCEEHARVYLSQESADSPTNALAGILAKQLKLEQTAEQLAKLDKKTCPVCGITFAEFRQEGRLGCGYDYVCFEEDLTPLLLNIHGAKTHRGKRPRRASGSPARQHRIIQMRREMQDAISNEDYERAGELRDQIRDLENGQDETVDPGSARSSVGSSEASDSSAGIQEEKNGGEIEG
ncbi:MAG: UvrB/UvrC motif-containing protein [Planctomycetales bacterium]|nr:UvrB/UvrC motif-containing protein [Planctomycetales bacterium]